jgi:hypothetical protein
LNIEIINLSCRNIQAIFTHVEPLHTYDEPTPIELA